MEYSKGLVWPGLYCFSIKNKNTPTKSYSNVEPRSMNAHHSNICGGQDLNTEKKMIILPIHNRIIENSAEIIAK